MLDRLLQIAEAESGAHRQSFVPIPLAAVVSDVVELYDATAEALGITLISEIEGQPVTLGDTNLLTSALVNLTDNALKYAGSGATVRVCATQHRDTVSMIVQDNGPGIPSAERARVVERFYRLDQSRSLPGNGWSLDRGGHGLIALGKTRAGGCRAWARCPHRPAARQCRRLAERKSAGDVPNRDRRLEVAPEPEARPARHRTRSLHCQMVIW